jgi:hypothetical protein
MPQPSTGAFPVNRVVAFLGPFIAILAGTLAAWLGQHFPGLTPPEGETARTIAQVTQFALGALITWALHHKFLDGWQQWEAGQLQPPPAAPPAASALPTDDDWLTLLDQSGSAAPDMAVAGNGGGPFDPAPGRPSDG